MFVTLCLEFFSWSRKDEVGLFYCFNTHCLAPTKNKKIMASHKRKLTKRYHAYKPVAEFIDSDLIPQSWIYEFGYWRAADVG